MRVGTTIAAVLLAWSASAGAALAQGAQAPCANPNALGVSRTVEIDTTGGPGFGFEHYKVHDFLLLKEVVLTFDDGPQVGHTTAILDALSHHCTKATFFSIGKMALGLPEILRDVHKRGHSIGTHTWSHQDLRKMKNEAEWTAEIEKGVSAVRRAVGAPITPFFRYPFLKDSKETLAHLASRNMAIFSTDIDSFDFTLRSPDKLVKAVMDKLEKKGKGIILMHDIQPGTAKAAPQLLADLKAQGYKVVHMKPKAEQKTLAEFDALIEKDVKGLALTPGAERPTASVVRTIDDTPAQPATAKAPLPGKK
jgi:peptidoglycan/xylan/chitin deacetylase (PgdA/CDA1 family)